MKKLVSVLSVFALVFGLTACGGDSASNTLKVGATPVPHAEILEVVKPLLEEKGITLEIVEFTDYVTPNTALNEGAIDANFFQHVPYLDSFNTDYGFDLVSVAKVHVEPIGGYSASLASVADLSDGAKVALPNDATNEGRALLLLQKQGLITLESETDLTQTLENIVENPLNLEFVEVDAAQLPRVLVDVELAIINTNYALEADLNPLEDALFIEDADSPYANILTTREDNKDDENIKALIEVLNSDEVRDFILEKYQGAVVPAF